MIVILVLVTALAIYFYSFYPTVEENCAKEGERFSSVYKDEYPKYCCEGLTEWHSGMDTRFSIADECYETGLPAGSPIGTYINCGNGICEDI